MYGAVYGEFLETCAYTPEQIEEQLPRVKKACDKAGITEEDVKRAKETLMKYYGAGDFRGARMALGLWFKAFVDLVLSGEEHEIRLYMHLPSMTGPLLLAAQMARPDIYVGCPDLILHVVLGGFFNRLDPLLDVSENWCLPPGVAHCGCSQAKLGARIKNVVPPASLHLSAGQYCDEAPKADEILEYHFGERVFYCNRCQDEAFDDPPMDDRHLKYLSANLERGRHEISEVTGVEVTKDLLMQAILAGEAVDKEFKRISNLRVKADPSPLSMVCAQMARVMTINMSVKWMKEVKGALTVLADEVQERVNQGKGVVEKGAPRIMLCYILPHVTPGLGKAIEDAGLNIACTEGYGSMSPWDRRENIAKLDPCDILAGVYLHSPLMVKPTWRADTIILGYKKANLDGMIMLPHYSCRTFGNDYPMVKDLVRRELGNVPVFILEADLFDPRYYTAEQARTRIESFAEMVKSAKVVRR